jgi:hypothetical protein
VYLSERFGVSAIATQKLGVFNAEIAVDNNMFVDPKMLEAGKEEFNGATRQIDKNQNRQRYGMDCCVETDAVQGN